MTQIRVMADALDPGACRKRRVHQHHGGMQAGQIVGDGLGVVAGDRRVREQSSKQPGANGGNLVQVQGIPDRAPLLRLPRAHSAMTASMPVPAEGSSTMSPGRMAAACSAA